MIWPAEKRSQTLLNKAAKTAAATDEMIHTLMRYDINVVNGIKNVVKEHKITDIVLGLRKASDISNTFLGDLVEGIVAKCATTTFVVPAGTTSGDFEKIYYADSGKCGIGSGFPLLVSEGVECGSQYK